MNNASTSWIEIDADAFRHNIECYQQVVGSDVMLGVVVKSNGYGHGLAQMGALCQENPHVHWLFTASLSEALQLRQMGASKPILVLSIIDADPAQACLYDIDLCVYSLESAARINDAARKIGRACRVHVKIDTGLSRFGFTEPQAVEAVLEIAKLSHVNLHGLYTHFARAASTDLAFTNAQRASFLRVVEELKERHITFQVIHVSNSPAATLVDLSGTNLVRLGAGAYGLGMGAEHYAVSQRNYPHFLLRQILSWHSRIIEIRTIGPNTPVSYDGTYVTQKETLIGIVPIGYYDGYDRRLSNKGVVFLSEQQQYAPVLGRVCMNHIVIDVSHVPHVCLGQRVLLCADIERIRAYDLACAIGGFNAREITARISQAMPRVCAQGEDAPYKKRDISYTECPVKQSSLEKE